MIWPMAIVLILPYLISRVQISSIKINEFVLFVYLSAMIYVTLIITSPYFLTAILSSMLILKIFIKSDMWKTLMKYTVYVSIFVFLFNILLNSNGADIIFSYGFLTITEESIAFSISMLLRLEVIMGAFALFNSNVEMEDLITILEKLKLPHKGILTTAIALRFFPIMLSEVDEISEIFRMRGVPVSSGGIKERVRSRYPIMGSLLNISLERAINIGEVLETRGYPSKKRKAWKKIKLNMWQKMASALLLLLAVISTIQVFLHGNFTFYPTLSPLTYVEIYESILMLILPLSVLLGRGA